MQRLRGAFARPPSVRPEFETPACADHADEGPRSDRHPCSEPDQPRLRVLARLMLDDSARGIST